MLKTITTSLLIWFIEFIVIAAMISESWSLKVIDKEQAMARAYLGATTAQQIKNDTDAFYDSVFIESGVVATVDNYFVPTEETRRRSGALADLGRDNVFPIIEERLNVIWASVYQMVYRLTGFLVWKWALMIMWSNHLVQGNCKQG